MREFYHNRDFRQKIVGASIERVAWFETNISKHLLVKKKLMPNQMEILAYINIKRKHNTSKDNSFPIISIAFAKGNTFCRHSNDMK